MFTPFIETERGTSGVEQTVELVSMMAISLSTLPPMMGLYKML